MGRRTASRPAGRVSIPSSGNRLSGARSWDGWSETYRPRLNPLVGESALRRRTDCIRDVGIALLSQSPRRGIGSPELDGAHLDGAHLEDVSIPSSGNRLSGALTGSLSIQRWWTVSIPSSGNRLSGVIRALARLGAIPSSQSPRRGIGSPEVESDGRVDSATESSQSPRRGIGSPEPSGTVKPGSACSRLNPLVGESALRRRSSSGATQTPQRLNPLVGESALRRIRNRRLDQ